MQGIIPFSFLAINRRFYAYDEDLMKSEGEWGCPLLIYVPQSLPKLNKSYEKVKCYSYFTRNLRRFETAVSLSFQKIRHLFLDTR